MFASQLHHDEDGDDYIYVPVEDNPNLEYRIKRMEPVGGKNDGLPKPSLHKRAHSVPVISYDSDSEEGADALILYAKDAKRAAVLRQDVVETPAEKAMKHADGSPVKRSVKHKVVFVSEQKGEKPPTIVDDAKVEQEFQEITKENRALVKALEDIEQLEQTVVSKMEQVLKSLLAEALQPVYQFIGSLEAVATAQAGHYQHYYGLQMGCKSLFDFKLKNRHLGDTVLYVAAEYARKLAGVPKIDERDVTFIGMRYPRLTVDQKARFRGNFDLDKHDRVPEWIWCMIGKPCIQFMLKNHTFGPIAMAAKELGYPEVKPLLDSDDVSYMFAQFVAHKFFTGPNVQVGAYQGGQVQYRVSSGILKTQAMTKWLMGCRLWFKEVYWGANQKRATDLAEAQTRLEAAQIDLAHAPASEDAKKNALDAEIDVFLAECQPERLLYHS